MNAEFQGGDNLFGVYQGSLFIVFKDNFSSSPNAFIGDPMFPEKAWIPAQKRCE
jgi:hypothetical protein